MSTPIGTRNVALHPGQAVEWVSEHGAHLLDYASYHLGPDEALRAVMSVLADCGVQAMPEGVTSRAWLLAVLRRNCRKRANCRAGYVPGVGPGMPDVRLMERAWTLVDPLGTEALRLMYRHELTLKDLSFVLDLPVDEVGRLATRSQDLIETLVSGLDALAHERHTCPDLAPLVEALVPDEQGRQDLAEFNEARMALLSHMVECHVCKRPFNIRYTVPQMISHPLISPLTAEASRRCVDSMRLAITLADPRGPATEERPEPADRPEPETGIQPETGTQARAESADAATPRTGEEPADGAGPETRAEPADAADGTRAEPADAADGTRAESADAAPGNGAEPAERAEPEIQLADPAELGASSADAAKPGNASAGAAEPGNGSADAAKPANGAEPAEGAPSSALAVVPAVVSRPGRETPLYDALLSQAWAREVLSRTGERPIAGQAAVEKPRRVPLAAPTYAELDNQVDLPKRRDWPYRQEQPKRRERPAWPEQTERRERPGRGDRPDRPERGDRPERRNRGNRLERGDGLERSGVGPQVRTASLKMAIIVVAGAAGIVTGTNFLGPVVKGAQSPARSTQPSVAAAVVSDAAGQEGLVGRLQIPSVVTLDEFGRGSMTLTASGPPLEWRISAPGLVVTPSSGTVKEGDSDVVTLRALRVRYWCGAPGAVSAPLTVDGPDDSITATVRWRTC